MAELSVIPKCTHCRRRMRVRWEGGRPLQAQRTRRARDVEAVHRRGAFMDQSTRVPAARAPDDDGVRLRLDPRPGRNADLDGACWLRSANPPSAGSAPAAALRRAGGLDQANTAMR